MSQITCCPTCRTLFKVEPEQLRVSDGWVRCGHCDGVFDASAHFQIVAEPVVEPNAQKFLPTGPLASEAPSGPQESDLPEVPAVAPAGFASVDSPLVARPAPEAADSPAPLASYLSAPGAAELQSTSTVPPLRQDSDARRALYGRESPSPAYPDGAALRPQADLTFVEKAQRRTKRSRVGYRVLAVLALLVLMALLSVQALVHERQTLAARYPALLPVLQALCQRLDCQVNPARVIEAIMIDSSSFTQITPDSYRLNFVLKNTALDAVAMPALEVILTGAQDEALVRKIVHPVEFGASSAWLYKDAPFAGTFNMATGQAPVSPRAAAAGLAADAAPAELTSVTVISPSTPITGYRLLAFYP
jgi:predicted Zn finger-like uncharacterized protein